MSQIQEHQPAPIILLGLGFTTSRLARRLLLRRESVYAVARSISRFEHLAALGLSVKEYAPATVAELPAGAVIIHTIPPLSGQESRDLRSFICALEPRRVVYISSTSVYGDQAVVTAESDVSPSEPKGIHRVEEENWLVSQPWSTLIVRPAAIYGPGRGVHVRIREGKPPRAAGGTLVSRIHAEDLAAILEAGIHAKPAGAWPCADELPCSTDTISKWCSRLLNVEIERAEPKLPTVGRSVDGRKLRELLNVALLYPDYRSGILASLAEEAANGKF